MNSAAPRLNQETKNLSDISIRSLPLTDWNPMWKFGEDDNSGQGYEDPEILYAIKRCEEDITNNRLLTVDEVFGKLGV